MSFILIAGILWGTVGIFESELSALGADGNLSSLLRMLFAFLIMFVVALFKLGKKILVYDKKVLFTCAMFGIVCNGMFSICYGNSIRLNGISTGAVLLYSAPVFTFLASKLLFHEKISGYKILSLVLNILGCTLTVTGGNFLSSNVLLSGLLYGLGSGFCYGMAPIIGKVAGEEADALTVSVYSYFFASLFLIIFMPPLFGPLIREGAVLCFGFLYGLIPTSLAYLAYYAGLKRIRDMSRVPVIASVEPVTAVLIGSLFYHENIGPINLAGICLVFFAIIIAMKR